MNIRQEKPYLTTRKLHPENQESPVHFLELETYPEKYFYKRNHFAYPNLTSDALFLPVSGHVEHTLVFTLEQIRQMPSKTIKTILECSGNKRQFFRPEVYGEQWEKGALSQGDWTGVPLRHLLQNAGILSGTQEVVFEAYDFGQRKDLDGSFYFARSLPMDIALHPDTIIAFEYNGMPIPFKHGFPFRVIVPGWYAMASVKWLKRIIVIDKKFNGPYQTIDYVFYPHKEKDEGRFPVTYMNVNSAIQRPQSLQELQTGVQVIKGMAWTGQGIVDKVEISLDNGKTWASATLSPGRHYSFSRWNYTWLAEEPGEFEILSRATDSAGRVQPEMPFWNRKGYGYNAIDRVKVKVL
ncbi:sulfite oxidase [Peribacillus sp. SCS-155]|uniref:sulfite oxidase n=1 Tax=Peribacillus sedimenti TaxID=3115297 RepID=UPI0039063629